MNQTTNLMIARVTAAITRAKTPRIDLDAPTHMEAVARQDNAVFVGGLQAILDELDRELDTLLLSMRAKNARRIASELTEDAQQEVRSAKRYLEQLTDYLENGDNAL